MEKKCNKEFAPTWHKPSEAYVLQGCIKNYSLVKLYNKALNNGHEIKILAAP